MKTATEYSKQISDFIYENPETIAVLLDKYGFSVSTKNKRLIEILNELNRGVFELLYDGNNDFANDLSAEMISGGYVYADAMIDSLINLGSSIIGAFTAKKQATKQRDLQKTVASAQIANQEKLGYLTIQTQAETDRINNITSNVAKYRDSLNVESTKRVNNTWVYILAIGGSLVLLYAIGLIGKKR